MEFFGFCFFLLPQISSIFPQFRIYLKGQDCFISTCIISWNSTSRKYLAYRCCFWASQMVLVVKNSPANAGDRKDVGSIPGLGRSPGGGHGNPLQYSCLENPMDRGAWKATVHSVAECRTQLKWLHACTCAHTHTHTHRLLLHIVLIWLASQQLLVTDIWYFLVLIMHQGRGRGTGKRALRFCSVHHCRCRDVS